MGMKSYGRAPTFLAMTGYEQVRSVAAELAGDHDAAPRVEFTARHWGVRWTGLFDDPGAAESAVGGCRVAALSSPEPLSLSLSLNPIGGWPREASMPASDEHVTSA